MAEFFTDGVVRAPDVAAARSRQPVGCASYRPCCFNSAALLSVRYRYGSSVRVRCAILALVARSMPRVDKVLDRFALGDRSAFSIPVQATVRRDLAGAS